MSGQSRNEGVPDSIVPFFATKIVPSTPWDWNYTTIPMKELNNRSIIYPRGHILGGSSSVSESFFESDNGPGHHDLFCQTTWPTIGVHPKIGIDMRPFLEMRDGAGILFSNTSAKSVI